MGKKQRALEKKKKGRKRRRISCRDLATTSLKKEGKKNNIQIFQCTTSDGRLLQMGRTVLAQLPHQSTWKSPPALHTPGIPLQVRKINK